MAYRFVALGILISMSTPPASSKHLDDRHFIELEPYGTSDGPLPTIWFSTKPRHWKRAMQYDDVVSDRGYKAIEALMNKRNCVVGSGTNSYHLGSQIAFIMRERDSSANVIRSCLFDGPESGRTITAISQIYARDHVDSPALVIWRKFVQDAG